MANEVGAAQMAWQVYNRTYLAQISFVNEEKGTCNVILFDSPPALRPRGGLELPHGGFSMNGHLSSWDRYMPQVNDFVQVAFGPKNEARIVGVGLPETAYAQFWAQKTSASSSFPKDFGLLRQGESDRRSAGGAYTKWDRDGNLLLAAGPTVQVRLDKQREEVKGEAGLWITNSVSSSTRFGDIKRQVLLTDLSETDVSDLDPTATKEWSVSLANDGLIPTLICEEQFGGVRDDEGVPRVSGQLMPLRSRRKIWSAGSTDAVAISAFSEEVDSLGNHKIEYGLTTTNVDVEGGPVTAFDVSGLSVDVSANTTLDISGLVSAKLSSAGVAIVDGTTLARLTSDVLAQVNSAIVMLGTPLALGNPAVHGTVLYTQLTAIVVAGIALSTTMVALEGPTTTKGIAWSTFLTALTAVQTILLIPPGTPASLLSTKVFVD